MTRGIGWRFLSMGRRVERLATMCSALQVAIDEGRAHEPRLAARPRRLERHLPLALPRRAGMAAGARHAGARRGQSALARVPGQGPGRVHRQARGDATAASRGDALAPAHAALRALDAGRPATRRASRSRDVLGAAAARRATRSRTTISLKFFSHAVPRSVLSLAAERHEPRRWRDAATIATASSTRRAMRTACRSSQSWQLAHLTPRELPWQRVVCARAARSSRRPTSAASERDSLRQRRHPLRRARRRIRVLRVRMLVRGRGRRPARRRRAPRPLRLGGGARRAARRAGAGRPARRRAWPSRARSCRWSEAARAYAAPSFARRPRLARGGRRPDAPHPCRLRVRARGDDRHDLGRRGARPAQRRLPGLRPRDARLPARPRPAGALCLGLPAHRPAAGPAAPARRRRVACLGRGVLAAATAGSSSIRPTTRCADRRYITLAWGADFADVVPLRGVILGGRGQTMEVAVSVIPR